MTGKSRRSTQGFDLRALPLAVKLAILLSLLLLGTILLLSNIASAALRTSQITRAYEQLSLLNRTQGLRAAQIIEQELRALQGFAHDPELVEGVRAVDVEGAGQFLPQEDLQLLADEFLRENIEFDAVAVVHRSGVIVGLAAEDPLTTALDRTSWAWFDAVLAREMGSPYIGAPGPDGLTGRNGVQIAVPVIDPETDVSLGVIYGMWDVSNLQSILRVSSRQDTLLATRDGVIVASAQGRRGEQIPPSLRNTFVDNPLGNLPYTDAEGTAWLYSYSDFLKLGIASPEVSALAWTVATRLPASSAEEASALLISQMRIALLIYAAVSLLVVGLATTLTLRPLASLTEAASAVGRGRYEVEIPALPPDEVGRLANVLRDLLAQLTYRVQRLQAAVRVSRVTVQALNLELVLNNMVEALAREFEYLEARIYLFDRSGKRLWLRAAAGPTSARLIQARHNVPVDDSSLLGRAVLLGEAQIARGREVIQRAGRSYRRLELTLPLRASGRVIGALYVSSERSDMLDQEDIDVLELLADQLAASVENARLFEQSSSSLSEIEALNRRLTRQAWQDYLEQSGDLRHTLDPENRWPVVLEDMPARAAEPKAETFTDLDGRSVLAAPVLLRNEVVGTLAVTRPQGERWSRDEVLLVEAIAARMGIIADSIRLIEETARRAEREQRVNEVSAQMLRRAASVDSVLRTALDELSGALGSDTVSLRIGPPPGEAERRTRQETSGNQAGPNGDGGEADDN